MKTIREDSEILINVPEALEVYKTAWLILTKAGISIKPGNGPGNGRLTRLSETLLRWLSMF